MRKILTIALGETALFGGAGVMEALGISLPWWAWLTVFLVGTGGFVMMIVTTPRRSNGAVVEAAPASPLAPKQSSQSKSEGILGGFFVFLCVLAVILIFIFVVDFPEYHWTHENLPVAETRKALAECEMRADEAIQGGALKDMARHDYTENCMIAEGFTEERVEEGGGE